jgi:tetratricopeptide (TPR) repeat protein
VRVANSKITGYLSGFASKGFALACAVVVFLSLGTAQAQQQAAGGVDRGHAEAQKAFRSRNYAEATRLFYLTVVGASGSQAKGEFGVAESLRKMGLHYGAAFFYGRIVAQGPKSDFFREALSELGRINAVKPLGKATISSLFGPSINPLNVPPPARGFFFFYSGLAAFEKKDVRTARADFGRVPNSSSYYPQAQYYLGVIQAINGDSDDALASFNRVSKVATTEALRELAIINIARIYYEKANYRRAFQYYSQIARSSDLWLQSLFEGAWAFFMIQKHNNTLGNIHTIHSPFYSSRFFPETYILQAISYLRLCRSDEVRQSLRSFQERYKPTFVDLNSLLKKYNDQPSAFFNVIRQYRTSGGMSEFPEALEVIDNVSRSDAYKEAVQVVRRLEREKDRLDQHASKWEYSGLSQVLRDSYEKRIAAAVRTAGQDLFSAAAQQFRYLKDLSDQTTLINYEMLGNRTDQLRARLNQEPPPDDGTQWGEGMRPLNLQQQLEYWPFEGEYWEDELGGYVYNIDSKCGKK